MFNGFGLTSLCERQTLAGQNLFNVASPDFLIQTEINVKCEGSWRCGSFTQAVRISGSEMTVQSSHDVD